MYFRARADEAMQPVTANKPQFARQETETRNDEIGEGCAVELRHRAFHFGCG